MSNQVHSIDEKTAISVGCTLARAALAAFEQVNSRKSRPSLYELLDSEEHELLDSERVRVISERLRQLLVRSHAAKLSAAENQFLEECVRTAQHQTRAPIMPEAERAD